MNVLVHPNPALKLCAQPVDPASDTDLRHLVAVMAKAMYEAPGVGLAATQLGIQKRVVVFDLDDGLVALVNPVLREHSEKTEVDEEGCLSLPGITVPVERSVSVVCEAQDIEGNPIRLEATELAARVLQHECDHLDGVLIIDRATPEERKAAIRRYNEAMEAAGAR